MSDFLPYSKEQQLRGSTKKKNKSNDVKPQKKLIQKTPIPRKRTTPRRTDKTRTHIATGHKKPTLYQRGYFDKDYDRIYEVHGHVCGERVISTPNRDVPPCSGGLEVHHVKFKSGMGRGVFRNGRPLCKAHHDFAHANFWYAEKWRIIHEEKYGEHYFKDEWDLYKEALIDEPTKEEAEKFQRELEKRTNWGI